MLGVDNTADGLRVRLRGRVLSALLGKPRSHGTSGTMYTVSLSNSSSRMRVTSYAPAPGAALAAAPAGLAIRPTVVLATSSLVDYGQHNLFTFCTVFIQTQFLEDAQCHFFSTFLGLSLRKICLYDFTMVILELNNFHIQFLMVSHPKIWERPM